MCRTEKSELTDNCPKDKYKYIWLEMLIPAPKMGVLGDFGPLNVIIHHGDPQKAHHCVFVDDDYILINYVTSNLT